MASPNQAKDKLIEAGQDFHWAFIYAKAAGLPEDRSHCACHASPSHLPGNEHAHGDDSLIQKMGFYDSNSVFVEPDLNELMDL